MVLVQVDSSHKKGSSSWVSVHLFYSNSLDFFLQKSIIPFIDSLTELKLIEQYFFIRYSEGGPHIRLRLDLKNEIEEYKIKTLIIQHFNHFFSKNPSFRKFNDLKDGSLIFPNDSIQFIEYIPEDVRYGGEEAVQLAEKIFHASSSAVLRIIKNSSEFNYSYTLGLAIRMHISMVTAMAISFKEIKNFFNLGCNLFLGFIPVLNSIKDLSVYNLEKVKIMDTFEKSYKLQKEEIDAHISPLFFNSNSDDDPVSLALGDWNKTCAGIYEQIIILKKLNRLCTEPFYNLSITNKEFSESQQVWSIYLSFMHMTNNRLGISNIDEAFICFLILKVLDGMKEK